MSFFKDFRGEIKMLVVIFVVAIVVSTGAILILKSLSTLPQVQLESQQESVEAQPTEEPTEDTSNWQTYRNEEFGFEMKYPSDWEAIDDVRDTLVGYIRKQRIESKGPAVVIYRNFYSIEASTISELKEGLDERNLNDIQLREMDEESFLRGYKSSIDSIGGFDVVLTEGTVDHAGDDIVPLLNLHVLLDSGDILFFVGRLQEPYQSMFQSIRNISMMNASNWQTYRNEEFGFEVKYPDSFMVNEKLGEIDDDYVTQFRFEDPLKPSSIFNGFTIETKTSGNFEGELEYRKFKIVGHIADSIKYEETDIEGKGYRGTKLEYDISTLGTSISFTTTIIDDGEYFYTITSNSNLVNQILSTFRFIELIDTSDWKTYKNEEYGFEMKYPNSWFLAAPTRDFSSESCKENPINEEITIFSRIKLEYCGFEVHTIPPQDTDVTVWVFEDPWKDTASILEPPTENLTMDGEPAVMYRYSYQQARPNINATRIYFNHKGRGYLVFLKNQDPQGYYYDPLYDQILSTFRFVEEKEYLTTLFPKGGEKLVRGQTYEIRWQAKGIDTVDIELLNVSTRAYSDILVRNYPNTGVYEWTIPLDPEKFLPVIDYVIDIGKSGELGVNDRSDTFTILRE